MYDSSVLDNDLEPIEEIIDDEESLNVFDLPYSNEDDDEDDYEYYP